MSSIPGASDLAAWMEITSPSEAKTAKLGEAIDAAVEAITDRCVAFVPPTTIPQVVRYAMLVQGSRNFNRSNSPEGVAGFGDLGIVRVLAVDPDVEASVGRHLKLDGFG